MLSVELKPSAWTPRLAGSKEPNPVLAHVREGLRLTGSFAYRRRIARRAATLARHMSGFGSFASTASVVALAVLTDFADERGLTLPEAMDLLADAPGESREAANWLLAQAPSLALGECAAG